VYRLDTPGKARAQCDEGKSGRRGKKPPKNSEGDLDLEALWRSDYFPSKRLRISA
jgi:hypothetical protein